jgi:hypothetical protein
MNLRTITIAATVVALVIPTAAIASGSRAPAESSATSSGVAHATGGQGDARVAAKLRAQIREAERRAARLGAQLRVIKVGSAQLRTELRATRQLVAGLRVQLDAAIRVGQTTGGSGGSGGGGTVDYCQSNMVGCTDAQLCAYWGMNCWLVEHVTRWTASRRSTPPPRSTFPAGRSGTHSALARPRQAGDVVRRIVSDCSVSTTVSNPDCSKMPTSGWSFCTDAESAG